MRLFFSHREQWLGNAGKKSKGRLKGIMALFVDVSPRCRLQLDVIFYEDVQMQTGQLMPRRSKSKWMPSSFSVPF